MHVSDVEGPGASTGPSRPQKKGTLLSRKVQKATVSPSFSRLKMQFKEMQKADPSASGVKDCLLYLGRVERHIHKCLPDQQKEAQKLIEEACQLILSAPPSPLSLETLQKAIDPLIHKIAHLKPEQRLPSITQPEKPLERRRISFRPPKAEEYEGVGRRGFSPEEVLERSKTSIEERRKASRLKKVEQFRQLPSALVSDFFRKNSDRALPDPISTLLRQEPSEEGLQNLARALTHRTIKVSAQELERLQIRLDELSRTEISEQEQIVRLYAELKNHELLPQSIVEQLKQAPTKDHFWKLLDSIRSELKDHRSLTTIAAVQEAILEISEQEATALLFTQKNKELPLPENLSSLFSEPTKANLKQLFQALEIPFQHPISHETINAIQKKLETLSELEKRNQQRLKNTSKEAVEKVCTLLERFGEDVTPIHTLLKGDTKNVDFSLYCEALQKIDPSLPEDGDFFAHVQKTIEERATKELANAGIAITSGWTIDQKLESLAQWRNRKKLIASLYSSNKSLPFPKAIADLILPLEQPTDAKVLALARQVELTAKISLPKDLSQGFFEELQKALATISNFESIIPLSLPPELVSSFKNNPLLEGIQALAKALGMPVPEPITLPYLQQLYATISAISNQEQLVRLYAELKKHELLPQPIVEQLKQAPTKDHFWKLLDSIRSELKGHRSLTTIPAVQEAILEISEQEATALLFTQKNKELPLPENLSSLFSEPTKANLKQLFQALGIPFQHPISHETINAIQEKLETLSELEKRNQQRLKNTSKEAVEKVCTLLERFGEDVTPIHTLLKGNTKNVDFSLYCKALQKIDPSLPEGGDFFAHVQKTIDGTATKELANAGIAIASGWTIDQKLENLAQWRNRKKLISSLYSSNKDLPFPKAIADLILALEHPTDAQVLALARQVELTVKISLPKDLSQGFFDELQKALTTISEKEKLQRHYQAYRVANSAKERVSEVISLLQKTNHNVKALKALLSSLQPTVDYVKYRAALKKLGFSLPEDTDFLSQIQATEEARISKILSENELEIPADAPFDAKITAWKNLLILLDTIHTFLTTNTSLVLPTHIANILKMQASLPRFRDLVDIVARETKTQLSDEVNEASLQNLQQALNAVSAKEIQARQKALALQQLKDENRAEEQVAKVCTLLERFGLSVQALKTLPTDEKGVLYDTYLTELKKLGFSIPANEKILPFLEKKIQDALVKQLYERNLPISRSSDPSARLQTNLQTLENFRKRAAEIKSRFLEIEKEAQSVPKALSSLMRGTPTVQKWEALIAWCNGRTSHPLPKSLSPGRREAIIARILSIIDETVRRERLYSERQLVSQAAQTPLLHAEKTIALMFSPRTEEDTRELLSSFDGLQNEALKQSFALLCSMDLSRLQRCKPLILDLLTNLAAGTHLTQDQAERVIGELILLVDRDVSTEAMPQDIDSSYRWVEQQARQIIRTRAEEYEATIQDPKLRPLYSEITMRKIQLPRAISDLIITTEGGVNAAIAPLVREVMIPKKEQQNAIDEQASRMLLHLRESVAFVKRLSTIKAPPSISLGASIVQISLGKPKEYSITKADTQRACLAALLTWHRQGYLGDCFVASQYEMAVDEATLWALDDFEELLSKGSVTRTFKDAQYSVDGLAWPALFVCLDTIKSMTKEQVTALYDIPQFQMALAQLGNISHDQWAEIISSTTTPLDIREIFFQIQPDLEIVQRALAVIESYENNFLQRVWQNATSSMQYVYTQDPSAPHSQDLYLAITDTLKNVARTASPSIPEPNKTAIQSLCARIHPCEVAQSHRSLSKITTSELALIFLYDQPEGTRKIISKELMANLLKQLFSEIFPTILPEQISSATLLAEFLAELKRKNIIKESDDLGEFGGALFTRQSGGLASQNIFERQLLGSAFQTSSRFEPLSLITWAKNLTQKAEVGEKVTLLVSEGNHAFRLLPNDRSLSSCFDDPERALQDQVATANQFRAIQRPFSEWMDILVTNQLDPFNIAYRRGYPEGECTVEEFVDRYLQELVFKTPEAKTEYKKNLLLKFLVQENKDHQRHSILRFADTNWEDVSRNIYFGLLYDPFQGKWTTVCTSGDSIPSSVYVSSDRLGELRLPLQTLTDKVLSESSQKHLVHLQRKTQKHLDHLQRDFVSLVSYIEKYIENASEEELDTVRELFNKEPESLAPQKYLSKIPTDIEDAVRRVQEMSLRYQEILQEIAIHPGTYRTIHGSSTHALLTDPERMRTEIEHLSDVRSQCLAVSSLFSQWGKNTSISQEKIDSCKLALSGKETPSIEPSTALLRCMETFGKLQTFEGYHGSSWGGAWIDATGELTVGTILLRQNSSNIGKYLQKLLNDIRQDLPDLSEERRASMISSLQSLQEFYPRDSEIQEATKQWIAVLKTK
jgi:hypothetical protein